MFGIPDADRTALEPTAADVVGLLAVALSVAVGALAHGDVPARVQVHVTLGLGPYVGPETLARPLALAVVPAVGAVVVLALRALPRVDAVRDELATAQPYYDAVTAVTAAALLAAQVGIVALNLA